MNKSEACGWVHSRMIADGMAVDDLVAAFTALVGHVSDESDRRDAMFRRCYEVVATLTSVSPALHSAAQAQARLPPLR